MPYIIVDGLLPFSCLFLIFFIFFLYALGFFFLLFQLLSYFYLSYTQRGDKTTRQDKKIGV